MRDVGWHAGRSRRSCARVASTSRAGEFVAVMGRNGAGKSTLLDIIAGLRPPTAGAVLLTDRPLDAWSAASARGSSRTCRRAVRADLPMRAEALVLMGRYPHADRWFESDDDRADRRRGDAALRLPGVSRSRAADAERRRTPARAPGRVPRAGAALLLLDEPPTFLDIDQQLHCFRCSATKRRGTACLAVTHDSIWR